MRPDIIKDSLHPKVKSISMVFLEDSGKLIRVLESGQGLVNSVGNVQALCKFGLLKEVLGGYHLRLSIHDLVNEISPLHHQGLHPPVATP